MNYKALYRVYRPTTFDEVKGQKFVVETLKNIVVSQKISHAYLFNGPHGTGKTSVAKIFATALNCKHKIDFNPCSICQTISHDRSGIIELDAASNNSADDIRNLIENANTYSLGGDYKIFIIDEVHMLSKSAFNAFLKTLEEPPKQTIFILATTEPHKIPNTILSRVQRFNFRRIDNQVIYQHLKEVLALENISYEPGVIEFLVNLANGSLRDGLSLVDQSAIYAQGKIKTKDLIDTFGITSFEEVISLLNYTIFHLSLALQKLQQLKLQGADPEQLLNNIINVVKDFILYQKTSDLKNVIFLNQMHLNLIKFNLTQAYTIMTEAIRTLETFNYVQLPFQRLEILLIQIHDATGNLVVLEKAKTLKNIELLKAQEKHLEEQIVTDTKINFLDKTLQTLDSQAATKTTLETISEADDSFDIVAQNSKTINHEDDFENKLKTKKNGVSKILNQLKKDNKKSSSLSPNDSSKKIDNHEFKTKLEAAHDLLDNTDEFINTTNEYEDLVSRISDIATTDEDQSEIISTGEMNLDLTEKEKDRDLKNELPADLFKTTEETNLTATTKETLDDTFDSLLEDNKPELTGISKIIPETDIHSQEEIINAFLQNYKKDQRKEQMDKIKELQKYLYDDQFHEIVALFLPLRLINIGKRFLIFSSSDNEKVFEAMANVNNPKLLTLVEKIYGDQKKVFVITKKLFFEVKKVWAKIKAKKVPLPETKEIKVSENGDQTRKMMLDILGDDLKEI